MYLYFNRNITNYKCFFKDYNLISNREIRIKSIHFYDFVEAFNKWKTEECIPNLYFRIN